ncbi:hypothetical protein ACFX14_018037 [Malus domestica]
MKMETFTILAIGFLKTEKKVRTLVFTVLNFPFTVTYPVAIVTEIEALVFFPGEARRRSLGGDDTAAFGNLAITDILERESEMPRRRVWPTETRWPPWLRW